MSIRPCTRIHLTFVPVLMLVASAAGQEGVPTRDQIDDAYKWDLTTIYADANAWEADTQRAAELIDDLAARQEVGFASADALYATLELSQEARWRVDKLVVYAHQLSDQDTRDNTTLAMKNRATGLRVRYGQARAWIEPTLLTLPENRIRAWYQSHPKLNTYRHYLEDVIRQKQHTLPPEQEELLAMMGNLAAAYDEVYNALAYAELIWPSIDLDGTSVTMSPARYGKYIRSADRAVRKAAFEATMEAYGRFVNTLAATFNGAVQRHNYFAKVRGFDSALESTMFPDNLPVSVYENLLAAVHAHLPALHRWAEVRQRLLGLDELHVYDLYQPLASNSARDIPYDAAVEDVIAALQPLGREYCDVMERGFRSRWIDVYETQGKRPGGYSWGSYSTQPYILLNYNGTPREVSTIAHEMGHSMHSYLTHANQPKIYGDYSGFVAEVAAIFNEILLEDYLLRQATTPDEKLPLLNQMIDNLRGTVYRQVMFAEFEHEAHAMAWRGEPLTADALGKLYMDIFHKYWGPRLVRDAEHGPYWSRIPHFYMNHYVYRYATSYCAAVALAEGVLAEKPGAREAYLTFLKSGSSAYPLDVLRKAGVDLTTRAPFDAALRRFERLVNEFDQTWTEVHSAPTP